MKILNPEWGNNNGSCNDRNNTTAATAVQNIYRILEVVCA